jgi:hypothetical protein
MTDSGLIRVALAASLAVVCAVAGASDAPLKKNDFGVAVLYDTTVCIAMPSLTNNEGRKVALVTTGKAQKMFDAVIEHEATTECSKLEKAMLPRPYYLAKLDDGKPEAFTLAVAVLQPLSFKINAGKITAISSNGATYQFSECTGSESIHLFAWKTKSQSRKPIWHAYYYLPYAVEPSCGKREKRAMDQFNSSLNTDSRASGLARH